MIQAIADTRAGTHNPRKLPESPMRNSLSRHLIAAGLCWAATATAQDTLLPETPPDAKPGECYGLVYVPPQLR